MDAHARARVAREHEIDARARARVARGHEMDAADEFLRIPTSPTFTAPPAETAEETAGKGRDLLAPMTRNRRIALAGGAVHSHVITLHPDRTSWPGASLRMTRSVLALASYFGGSLLYTVIPVCG
ncbi:hypothetical protein WMF31_21835 [Sorangium sp. So ce1036]|uniref:hypothetical protein n=1 Tax=Sorangium sp. So ce1036 TaxID=3133328 RepID=UPI003F0EBF9C